MGMSHIAHRIQIHSCDGEDDRGDSFDQMKSGRIFCKFVKKIIEGVDEINDDQALYNIPEDGDVSWDHVQVVQ